jgi:transcriptional regulator with XRE-family HTH domain
MKFKYEELRMSPHPEERRIAGLLRELIVQSGMPLERLEERLGWTPGHLRDLLEGGRRLSFEDVLEILPLMGTTPTDFFAWLYGFDAKDPVAAVPEGAGLKTAGESYPSQRALDRRFEQSLKVVRAALARRRAWKEEKGRG